MQSKSQADFEVEVRRLTLLGMNITVNDASHHGSGMAWRRSRERLTHSEYFTPTICLCVCDRYQCILTETEGEASREREGERDREAHFIFKKKSIIKDQ